MPIRPCAAIPLIQYFDFIDLARFLNRYYKIYHSSDFSKNLKKSIYREYKSPTQIHPRILFHNILKYLNLIIQIGANDLYPKESIRNLWE